MQTAAGCLCTNATRQCVLVNDSEEWRTSILRTYGEILVWIGIVAPIVLIALVLAVIVLVSVGLPDRPC